MQGEGATISHHQKINTYWREKIVGRKCICIHRHLSLARVMFVSPLVEAQTLVELLHDGVGPTLEASAGAEQSAAGSRWCYVFRCHCFRLSGYK